MEKVNLKNNRTVKSYSESFKQKVLQELAEGRSTKSEIRLKYGLGSGTIYSWIRKYNKLALYNPKIRIEMPGDIDKIKELQSRLSELEKALSTTQLRHLRAEADLAVALEMLGYKDKEEFEKKQKSNLSKKR